MCRVVLRTRAVLVTWIWVDVDSRDHVQFGWN
jgi:hypothetical protein